MTNKILAVLVVAASVVFAEQQPFERYQSIVDREMFGKTPPNFDPTKPSSEAPKTEQKSLTREQEVLKSSIHFSAINVTPDGATAVGFTDNANPKLPIHYYLKVGEERNGWKVVEADAVKATMRIVKNDVEVSLSLGANSAKGGGTTAAANAAARDLGERGMAAGRRAGLLGQRRGQGAALGGGDPNGPARLGSLRERRAAREQERQAEAEKEKAQREAEREEQRKELQQLKDELKAQRDAAEKERAEREAERAAAQERAQHQADVNANDEN
jgi:hypothetical protein